MTERNEAGLRILISMKHAHSNSAGLVQGLTDAGHEVHLVTSKISAKSVSSVTGVEPTVLPYSRLSLRMWGKGSKRLHVFGAPRVIELVRTYRRISPHVVLAKDLRTMSLALLMLARVTRATGVLMWNKPRFAPKWPIRAAIAPLFLPRRKIHMGFYGDLGRPLPLGGALGTSTLLPYPAVVMSAMENGHTGARSAIQVAVIGSFANTIKRMTWVSQAFHRMGLHRHADITYIGHGDEDSITYREIREYESTHGLTPSRILLNIPHSELLQTLPKFDVLAHPSARENFGAVITEAMAAGLAVICSDRCGAKVCFEDGKSGLVFTSRSQEDFDAKLSRLVTEPGLARTMGAAAQARANAVLTPSAWTEGFERILASRTRP
jgi:glycosyltransferase involved in cell wall biosynthesis